MHAFLYRALSLVIPFVLVACSPADEQASTAADAQAYDAVVSAEGSGDNVYNSLTAALEAAPADESQHYRVLVKAGKYYEKLTLTRDNVAIIGEGMNKTVIHYDAYAGQKKPDGTGNWGTTGSATLTVDAKDIHFADLTINNSFDFLTEDAKSADDPTRVSGLQAVAVKLESDSDRVSFDSVAMNGYQDTLYVNGGRSYFYQNRISGNVDFIFGNGNALFHESVIITRPRGKQSEEATIEGYVTAPSTNIEQEFGLTFIDCELRREPGVPDNSTTLGRPWHPTTTFPDGRYADPDAIGKAVFIRSHMDAHISPEGWSSMGGTPRQGTEKRIFTPEESRFFEYENYGPGAVVNGQRPQLSEEEAERYTVERILGDWEPPIGG